MLSLRVSTPTELTAQIRAVLEDDVGVSAVAVHPGASVQPAGDIVTADIAREAANGIVEQLLALGVHREGTMQLVPVDTWMSRAGLEAELEAPGSSADAVVWPSVALRAYDDSELSWSFLSFMILATLIASIAIVLDSQILVIGAMVLGPEFGAVAAMGVGLVRRRWRLLRRAVVALVVGFTVAIMATFVAVLVGRAIGWITLADVTGPRPDTRFIYHPDKWSLVVAVIAGAAGVLSLTSSRMGGLTGVFISVTTIPAAGNIAVALAFGLPDEIGSSTVQLVVNLVGMAVAGWLTLLVQHRMWSRVDTRRLRRFTRRTLVDALDIERPPAA
ncbi:DUF389 domain-containing protein [Cellulomonas composti]|uniref:DUF389 domain-containing protein n=1 Tax=Cellulomonas composti TaxID=266130 RepID=UPI0011BF696F|nr:DUF389 domain-containing protein [Cellulomonas composti]